MNFDKLVDETKAVDASTITTSDVPWKERIVSFLLDNQESTPKEILEATDPKYKGDENYTKRKHCLDSQFTYIKQDLNVALKRLEKDKIVALGVIKDKKLIPFKSAVKYL